MQQQGLGTAGSAHWHSPCPVCLPPEAAALPSSLGTLVTSWAREMSAAQHSLRSHVVSEVLTVGSPLRMQGRVMCCPLPLRTTLLTLALWRRTSVPDPTSRPTPHTNGSTKQCWPCAGACHHRAPSGQSLPKCRRHSLPSCHHMLAACLARNLQNRPFMAQRLPDLCRPHGRHAHAECCLLAASCCHGPFSGAGTQVLGACGIAAAHVFCIHSHRHCDTS